MERSLCLFELTQIMRQKDELNFAELLNRLRLTNGAPCVVKYIEYKQTEAYSPNIIWVKFDDAKAGLKTRSKFQIRHFYHQHIDEN